MTDPVNIRRVNVEFLRPGPSHNQLLSPYTQYLAVCNDAGVAVVKVPYEQREFERRLKELRYETGDLTDRLQMLHEIGRNIGQILEDVPGFTGAVMNNARSSELVHIRLTLSAAELALLPFELAEVPVGSAATALSIQVRPPVSITRHIRTVSSEGLTWPDRPRILFVAGSSDDTPFTEHRETFIAAVRRFQYPIRDDRQVSADGQREQFGDLLTVLKDPTLVELQRECASTSYTHVHVLTHGDLDVVSADSYGIVLRHENGSSDVVSGERFVSAITRVGHSPSVVTVASCDSGNVGSVIVPGASFVHAVHQAGIPFVVGSQFPLSKDGSIPLTARLYEGLLWGDHPLHVVQQARAELHARYNTDWHDWASIVVYEALPPALDEQLDALRYRQAKRATDAALERVDRWVASDNAAVDQDATLRADVDYGVGRLPLTGQFRIECLGLRASSRKRLAQAAFALVERASASQRQPFADGYDLLDQARLDYRLAVKGLLVNDERPLQRFATLHWVLVQLVSVSAILGHDKGPDMWEAARVASEEYLDHQDREQRAWAHGSLAELWLIRLADADRFEAHGVECADEARHHAEELNRLYPGVDAFPIKSTRRQFERYLEWWGTDRFRQELRQRDVTRSASWTASGGLLATATQLCDTLRRRQSPGSAKRREPSSSSNTQLPPGESPAGTAASGAKARSRESRGPARPETPSLSLSAPNRDTREAPFFTVEALPAGHGDCLWIEYGDRGTTHRVLIDCGTQPSSRALLARIEAVPANERFLELFVLSHIDADHIGGALPLFRAVKKGLRFGDLWFNGWRHVSGQLGARQAEMFSTAIQDFELPWNVWRDGAAIVVNDGELPVQTLPGGMRLTLLSPTRAQLDRLKPVWTRELKRSGLEPGARVDYDRFLRGTPTTLEDLPALNDIDALADVTFGGDNGAPNGTSIAFLAEFENRSVLFAADAHAPVLVASIQKLLKNRAQSRLKVDLFKVSHHGSQNNVSAELIQQLDCSSYLISTNGDHFFHPDRQAIARVFKYGGDRKTLYFNYSNRLNQVWGDAALESVRTRYGCRTVYPEQDRPGIVVNLL